MEKSLNKSWYKLRVMSAVFASLCFLNLNILNPKLGLFAAEVTFEATNYAYEELDGNNQFFMSDKSSTPLLGFGLRDWDIKIIERKLISNEWKFLYTIEYSFGKVNYSSAGTGTKIKDYYKGRVEGYVSKRININKTKTRSFVGLGYRDLFDDSGNQLTSTNHMGYDRLSQYYYMPVGMIWYINDVWLLKSQYNYLIQGKQTSYLYDVLPGTYNVNPVNTQRLGWGFDVTLNKKLNSNWSYYGFFRYWDLEDSDSVSCSSSSSCMEPRNTTNEIGIGISYGF